MKKCLLFLFALGMFNVSFGQLTGTYTIPGAPYATIAAAITALNTSGVGSGGVIFNITAGYTETFASPTAGLITTNTGTSSNQIIFQKSGSGANPVITSGTGTATLDAIICFGGVKYITFDGINVIDNASNTTTAQQMEWGYAILKASATQGSQNITIKNCTITLNKTNTSTYGIYSANHTPTSTSALTVTAVTGQNSNNKIYGNTFANSYGGIYMNGYSDGTSPYAYYDQNNDIGSVTGNTFNNFAGAATTAYVIYVAYQNVLTVANSSINGGTGSTGALYGIYGGTATNANVNIYGNTITLTSAGTTAYMYGIYNPGLATGGTTNTLAIYNNTVQNCTYPTATSAYFYGIYSSASAYNVNFYGNVVNNNLIGGSAYTYTAYVYATAGTCNVYNNSVTNNQRTGNAASGYFYCLYVGGTAAYSIHDNTVSGNSATALTGYYIYMYSIYCSNSSAISQTVYNNTVHDQTVVNGYTSGYSIYGIYAYCPSATAATNSVHDNTVYNLSFTCTSTGYCYVYGIASYYANNVYNNTIHDITQSTTTSYGYSYALYCYYGLNCYSNTIYNITETATTGYGYGYGIYYYTTNASVGNISYNKIYGISMAGTTSGGYYYGIYMSNASGGINIYNNYISDIKAPASQSATGPVGIYISTTTNAGVYYNTVYLNATSTSTGTFNSAALYVSTTPNVELRNNILVNTSTAPGSTTFIAAVYRRSSTTLTTYAATSNNNDFYAGTPSTNHLIYYDGTNSDQTLAAFKTRVSPRDAQSVTEMPPFVNVATTPYNLHLQITVPTQLESGGSVVSTPVSITDDYDNDARYPNTGYPNNVGYNATAPDIGADEFGGLLLDITPPAINFTPFANTSTTTPRTLSTLITDQTGVPTTGTGLPVLYWKKNWTGTWTSVQAVSGGSGQYTFPNIGTSVVLGDSIYYYLVAQDMVTPTPNIGANPSTGASGYSANPPAVSTPPTTLFAYKIVPAMCGSFNVGSGQTYASLTAAIDALNNSEMTCPVTLVLTDAAYGASETFPIILNNVAGSSATNTITIKPAAGVTPVVSGSSTTGILVLWGTQYLTIDGSNSGGSDQSLTFQQTNTVSNTYCFGIFNDGTVGASNCTIKNCKFLASSQVTNTTYAFIFNGAGGGYTNVIVKNNQIYSAYEGMQLAGISGKPASNCQVINNTIGSAVDATSLTKYGILMAQADNCLVANNEIQGGPAGNTNYSQAGIYMSTGTTNAKIRANKIHDWFYATLSGGWGCWGIYYVSDATTVNEISNNVIYNIKSDSYTSGLSVDNLYGVYITSGGNIKFYHNSINLQGNFTSASYTNATACLAINSGVTLMDVQNNIFKNSLQPSAPYTSYTYDIQCGGAASTFSALNYNDYWDDGNGPNIGYLNGSQYATLAAWKTATGMEAAGINVNPLFISATNLIPTATTMNKAGVYIPLVPTDYAGTMRTNPPDVGAYEFAAAPLVNTTAATAVTTTTATLNGSINANSFTVNSFFDYGLTTAYGNSIAGVPPTVTGTSSVNISGGISSLTPATLYHYRARGVVTVGGLIAYGPDMTFTTAAAPATVVTTAATAITTTTATLNGTVNANNSPTTVTFEYGLTLAYGSLVTAAQSPVSGSTVTNVSAPVTALSPSTLYHFRVVGTNSGGTANGNDMTFTTAAVPPTVVTNPASNIGVSTAQLNGSVNANNASTTVSFDWGLTTGYGNNVAGIPSPVTGNSPTAVLANIGGLTTGLTYHFRCNGTNSGGTTNGTDQSFVAGCQMPGPAGPIAGPPSVCANSTNVIYSVGAILNALTYTWSVPAGASIVSGQGTQSIIVNMGTNSGSVTVFGANGCGSGIPSSMNVTVNPLPNPSISGNSAPCQGTSAVYTTQSGMTAYNWAVSAGGTITGGAGTSVITVLWNNSGAQTINVNYNNAAGCSAPAPTVYNLNVVAAPTPTIAGPTSMCVNSGYYTYSTQTGFASYGWTISPGGIMITGQGSSSIMVNWVTAGPQTVSVNVTNAAGCWAVNPPLLNVTVNPIPNDAGTITGVSSVCGGATNVAYSVGAITNATAYVWTLPAGATIASGAGTNSILVNFAANASSGNITVYGNNLCGNGNASPPFPVTVTALPADAGTITGPASVCQGTTGVIYSVPPIANATSYTWSVPTGATIVSGSTTNTITVNFSASASSGVVSVFGTNSCGDGAASNLNVTLNPVPAAPVITNTGSDLSSNAPAGNQWYFSDDNIAGTAIPGATGQNYSSTKTGWYWDEVTLNGCESGESNHIFILFIGVGSVSGPGVSIYPVPNDGRFSIGITTASPDNYSITVLNNLGVTVREVKDVNVTSYTDMVIDLRPVAKGVYTVIIQNSQNRVVKKIMINK